MEYAINGFQRAIVKRKNNPESRKEIHHEPQKPTSKHGKNKPFIANRKALSNGQTPAKQPNRKKRAYE
ncbi:hypothetical protein HYFRA_00009751 [Hymenoscyphus fraxineus]|uniref:Uncharacterized protein n=1 Tax=Hymenoscyphus fraxineus TaxID=746836 RepID=A0A9N9PRP2_9HELO|nr:hypothetical protein HYFRA_00009751 [Hymenoscyphus fraxineus]